MADLVRVRNTGALPLRISYNSQATIVQPGQDGFVDREAACAHFGVWWSVVGGRPIDRKMEYLRIRGLYGCLPGAPGSENALSWEKVKPKVEIYELDGPTKVSTVFDDPEGTEIPVNERSDDAHLRDTVAQMQEQLDEMKAQIDQKDAIISAGTASEIPAADSPESAPRRTRRTPDIQAARQ